MKKVNPLFIVNSKKVKLSQGKYIFLLLALLFFYQSQSQVINASISDSSSRFPITQLVSILKVNSVINLDSALKLNAENQFIKAPNKPVLVLNYDPYYYWFRFVIRNDSPYERKLMLLMAPIGMREGKLYQKKSNAWKVIGQTGIKYAFKDRPYQFAHNVFPFTLSPRSQDTLYLQTDAKNIYKSFGFALIKPKELKMFENKIYFVFGIIVGLLLLFCILNISLYFVLKIKIHLWYALYISFLFLIVMKNDHLDQQFLNWDSEQAYQFTPYMAIGAIAISILMHVVHLFLRDVIIKNRTLFLISNIVKINVLLSGLAHFLFFQTDTNFHFIQFAFLWAKYSTLLAILMILVIGTYSVFKGYKSALFILAGQLVFLVGVTQRLFFPSTISFLFPPTTFHIGIILETLIITLGLVYQYYWLEKEQNIKRELAFKEELHTAELQIKEHTMQNISQEIHDNILQILGIAKLDVSRILMNGQASIHELSKNSHELISKAITDLRTLAKTLDTDYVSNADLISMIRLEIEWINNTGKLHATYQQEGKPYTLPGNLVIFRIFQESINNAMKHSNASDLIIKTVFKPTLFQLQIQDNGKGFDLEEVLASPQGGLGIKNLDYRIKKIGGTIEIASEPGKGTTVKISLPVIPVNPVTA